MNNLKEILGEELFNEVAEKLGNNKIDIVNNGNWIPKDKFNSVNDDLKEIKKQLSDRDLQLQELGEKAKGNEELLKEIEALKESNKKIADDYQLKLAEKEFNYALETALAKTKARNIKALKSLLDLDKVSMKEDGALEGLDEQIKAIKESDNYLFEVEQVTGRVPNTNGKSSKGINPFSKEHFNLTEQGKLFKENPALAKQMMEQANQ